MADIVERLRVLQKYQLDNDAGEAADTIEALREELTILKGDMPARAAILKLAEQHTEIEALRAENARLQAELTEYKRNGIVDVTGSINYRSGYDDGFRAARAAMGESDE